VLYPKRLSSSKTNSILVGEQQGKTSSEKPRHRWKDNVRNGLREIGFLRCKID
jgi:hypothetical protein